ncbi:hypothetical protein LR69_04447 [Geobacillus sp. BCO2]|nr:hypothetical protein LR69_04447 [Geobacillus sp. BCO2]
MSNKPCNTRNAKEFSHHGRSNSCDWRPIITPERPLKGAGGRKLTQPTEQAIFQLFWYVKVVLLELPDGQIQRAFGKRLAPDQRRILQGLDMDESFYV